MASCCNIDFGCHRIILFARLIMHGNSAGFAMTSDDTIAFQGNSVG